MLKDLQLYPLDLTHTLKDILQKLSESIPMLKVVRHALGELVHMLKDMLQMPGEGWKGGVLEERRFFRTTSR